MRRIALAVALLLASMLLADPGQADASGSARVSRPLRTAVSMLKVAAHSHVNSYNRDAEFGTWISQSGRCDTRAVVLKQESLVATTQNSNCTVKKGKWRSLYNGRTYFNAYGGAVQIDHMVPVENAWISGAWRWTKSTRVAFYNDLGDSRSLVAVDGASNDAKSASDPSEWMPSVNKCTYVRYFVAVKLRWKLTVTSTEKSAITRYANHCSNTNLSYRPAAIKYN